MNSGIVPREPKCRKNQVADGGCRGANPCAALPQNCKTRCDQPDARDVGQYVLTRKIFDGLMRGIECTPGDIQNAGESSAQAIEPNSNFHLLISHESLSEKPELIVWQQWYIEQSHFRKIYWTIYDAQSR